MSRTNHFAMLLLFTVIILVGCGPSEEEIAAQVASSVIETVEAVPTVTPYPTLTPFPEPTPYPTFTPLPTSTPFPTFTPLPTSTPVTTDLDGLYCNFGFCVGYPQEPNVAIPNYATDFLDEIVGELNTVEEGGYVWLTDDVLVFLHWYVRSGSPKDRVENALDDPDYTDVGEVIETTINDIEVAYAPYQAVESVVPYRLFSVWRCGDRLFYYSIRSEEDIDLTPVLESAISSFVCSAG